MTLPPLPEINYLGDDVSYGYDACDMRAYGEACAAAERERCAKLCEGKGPELILWWGKGQANAACLECAAAIRAQGEML